MHDVLQSVLTLVATGFRSHTVHQKVEMGTYHDRSVGYTCMRQTTQTARQTERLTDRQSQKENVENEAVPGDKRPKTFTYECISSRSNEQDNCLFR